MMQRRGFMLTTAAGVVLPCRRIDEGECSVPDVVMQWNEAFLAAARKESPPPCLLAWKLAQMHVAMHRAMEGCEPGSHLVGAHAAASVAAALYPGAIPEFERLLARQVDVRAKATRHEMMGRGRAIAAAVLEERKADGASTGVPYVPSERPGQWRRTPPGFRPPELPHWAVSTKPFLIDDVRKFLPPPPPELGSPQYAAAWDEVRRFGAKESAERTADQTLAARFWSDFSYTETPPGHWNAILREIVVARQVPVAQQARVFCLLNETLADAAMACWHAKYHFNTWRPVTAIAGAVADGNEATRAEADWLPLLNSPPHPEYVSGHSTFSAAAAAVLRHHFGGGTLPITAASDAVKGVIRRFGSPEECVQEISQSRLWGGIHFRFSCDAGVELGRAVAAACARKFEG